MHLFRVKGLGPFPSPLLGAAFLTKGNKLFVGQGRQLTLLSLPKLRRKPLPKFEAQTSPFQVPIFLLNFSEPLSDLKINFWYKFSSIWLNSVVVVKMMAGVRVVVLIVVIFVIPLSAKASAILFSQNSLLMHVEGTSLKQNIYIKFIKRSDFAIFMLETQANDKLLTNKGILNVW